MKRRSVLAAYSAALRSTPGSRTLSCPCRVTLHGEAKLSTIASRLRSLKSTHLTRRLATEGLLNFSDVLENLKVDLAGRYLAEKDLSISQVAWLLGLSGGVSSLTHAFKRWTGRTPRQARLRMAPRFCARARAKLCASRFFSKSDILGHQRHF